MLLETLDAEEFLADGLFVVPWRGLGLSPLVILLGLLGWGVVLGPMGALLAIPLTLTLKQVLPVLLGEPAPAERSL